MEKNASNITRTKMERNNFALLITISMNYIPMFLSLKEIFYLPDPTWDNHIPMMKNTGLEVVKNFIVFFYSAYHQGFASGDSEVDA